MNDLNNIDIDIEVNSYFDDSSVSGDETPAAVILAGGVATGKTTLRRTDYSQGYVLIDAAEIFHRLSRGAAFLDFPDALSQPLEQVGSQVARRAIAERRHIVTEVIGDEPKPTIALIDSLKSKGYRVEIVALDCDLEETIRRNEERGDNISAYFAEPFQCAWISEACKE